jgi:hypothetical protein
LNNCKITFWNLFSQDNLSSHKGKFEIVFVIDSLINSKSFKSLWNFNQHNKTKTKKFPPKFDKNLGCYNTLHNTWYFPGKHMSDCWLMHAWLDIFIFWSYFFYLLSNRCMQTTFTFDEFDLVMICFHSYSTTLFMHIGG